MAVYERAYRRYTGRLTAPRWRFLVVPRYAYRDVFRSRLFLLAFAAGFVVPAIGAVLIYLRYNVAALATLGISPEMLDPIDLEFFLSFMLAQAAVTGFITLLIGPALVAQDLSDNALPLYLCRPFTRGDYVVGKASVLVILTSILTWVVGLLLIALQTSLGGLSWLTENWRFATGIVIGSWAWIAVLTIVTLAVSAWVRRLSVARATLVALALVPMALGNSINGILETHWGGLISIGALFRSVWLGLFGQSDGGFMQEFVIEEEGLEAWSAWLVLIVVCAISFWLLRRKLQAYEVVRS